MDIKDIHTVYFLGAGGIGMSSIARFFNLLDCNVAGYDKTKTILTEELVSEGIHLHYTEDVDQIPASIKNKDKGALVVYTPAIPNHNREFQYLKEQGIQLYKRSEVLGLISKDYFTIAVAGTHGKTTTSSIVAHILNEAGVNCIAFLGGISLNFNSNLFLNDNADVLVVEADEYDRSFLTLSPDIALITSVDADHLDIYGDKHQMKNAYSEFVDRIKTGGKLISKKECIEVLDIRPDIETSSYSASDDAETSAVNVSIESGDYIVDIKSRIQRTNGVKVGLPGIHNVENAIGAFAISEKLGIDKLKIKEALGSYKGVKRRFEIHIKTNELVYIDDYAHHPSELEMCIQSVRELYPGKKITGVFQPHLYSRTRDFVGGFAESLSLLDELILLDIYPARELPIEGITSKVIEDKVSISAKAVVKKDDLLNVLYDKHIEVLLTLGAGDIDVFVSPIKEQLLKKYNGESSIRMS